MKVEQWEEKLNEYLVANRDRAFAWGEWDCCVFAAGAVKAITGDDYMQEFRGKYDDAESANEALTVIGAGDLYRTLVRKFGPAKAPLKGRKGDVALIEGGALGIVVGSKAICLGPEGGGALAFVPLPMVKRVFWVD